jgi:hypothetical protein
MSEQMQAAICVEMNLGLCVKKILCPSIYPDDCCHPEEGYWEIQHGSDKDGNPFPYIFTCTYCNFSCEMDPDAQAPGEDADEDAIAAQDQRVAQLCLSVK